MALDDKQAYGIYDAILRQRRYPAGLFRVASDLERELKAAFDAR